MATFIPNSTDLYSALTNVVLEKVVNMKQSNQDLAKKGGIQIISSVLGKQAHALIKQEFVNEKVYMIYEYDLYSTLFSYGLSGYFFKSQKPWQSAGLSLASNVLAREVVIKQLKKVGY